MPFLICSGFKIDFFIILFYMKHLTLLILIVGLQSTAFAATFNSNATGQFNSAASWVLTGGADADGIPDVNDDVTILTGHVITCSSVATANSIVAGITINLGGTLTVSSPRTLSIWGNYQNNGTESGNGSIIYKPTASTTISGSGTFSATLGYTWSAGADRTINAGTVINKGSTTLSIQSAIVTNLGTITVLNAAASGTGLFVNGTGATLTIRIGSAFSGAKLDASAANNTVILAYYSLFVINPLGGVYHHLTIGGTGSLRLSANLTVNGNFVINGGNGFEENNFTLSLKGDFTKNGNFIHSNNGGVLLNGTTAQNVFVGGAVAIKFGNLSISNTGGVTLATGNYTIELSLTLLNGNLNLNSRPVTMASTASNTAVIGPCIPGGTFSGGNITFQRFISARAAGYSDMSGSLVGQTLTDWDDDLILIYTYAPPDFFPSVFGYDETAFDYIPITSSAQSLDPGVGFEVYLDSDGTYTSFNATTITTTGLPTMGTVDMSGYVTFNNDGWNLIGNPYHANLDFDLFGDATLDIAGDMLVYDEVSDDFVTVSGGAGELFAPNQGFWVNVTGPSPFIQFTEAYKSTSTSSNFRHKKTSMFTLRLKSVDQTKYTSGTSFRFTTTPETAGKWGSLPFKKVPHPDAPAFCSKSTEGKDLKINLLNSTENTISVPLKFTVGLSGIYTIEQQDIESANAEGFNCISLYDNVLNKAIDIANENYQFYAEKGEADTRFTLVMAKNGDCKKAETIVVNSNEVDINRIGDNTLVKLNFENETGVSITITDLLGQNITPSQVLVASVQDVYIPVPATFYGIYLVTVSYNNKTVTRKLYK